MKAVNYPFASAFLKDYIYIKKKKTLHSKQEIGSEPVAELTECLAALSQGFSP